MKKIFQIELLLVLTMLFAATAWGQLYWRVDGTSGTLTSSNWSTTGSAPFTSAWADGSNIIFQATSAITNVTNTPVGNITVNPGFTVTLTAAGTFNPGGAIRTMDIGAGSTLAWNGQGVSTSAGNGFIKNGDGIWNIGAQGNAYPGGFTLCAGTVISSGNNGLGGGAWNINGGTIQSSGGRTYINNITIGGDFALSGTGTATHSGTVDLGAASRTITNSTASGGRVFSGIISGGAGSGFTFTGSGAGTIDITGTSNTFSGNITVTGAEVTFANDGSFGVAPGSITANSIVVDGGRLTLIPAATTSFTLNTNRGIQVGATANTGISVKTGTSVTYNGIIADKPSATGIFTKQGGAIFILGGVSTYSGATSINNGIVRLSTGDNRLPTGTTLNIGEAGATNLGKFDMNGFNQEIAGLNSSTGTNATANKDSVFSTTSATLRISGSGTYSYGLGTTQNSGIISGLISLVKTGSGTQTLGDANTYTGLTTVSGGTLQFNRTGGTTIPATNDIIINGGILKVSSDQTVNNLTLSAGTLTIDNGVTLTVTGTYTNSGGILDNHGTLLPVELTSFTAIAKGRGVELAWKTATEVNNYGFEIERRLSTGDANWMKIGFVAGNGTTNAPQSYSYVDTRATGTMSYRLKQIDRDGKFEYSSVVEATIAEAATFSLNPNYPNPFNPATNVTFGIEKTGLVTLKVYNILGGEVATLINTIMDAGVHSVAFDARNLPSGVYYARLQSGTQTAIRQMILMK